MCPHRSTILSKSVRIFMLETTLYRSCYFFRSVILFLLYTGRIYFFLVKFSFQYPFASRSHGQYRLKQRLGAIDVLLGNAMRFSIYLTERYHVVSVLVRFQPHIVQYMACRSKSASFKAFWIHTDIGHDSEPR